MKKLSFALMCIGSMMVVGTVLCWVVQFFVWVYHMKQGPAMLILGAGIVLYIVGMQFEDNTPLGPTPQPLPPIKDANAAK